MFARAVHPSYLKMYSATWLERFKNRNGIGGAKLTRRASETNTSDNGSLNPESDEHSASQTPNGISPTSPRSSPFPLPLFGTKSEETIKSERLKVYFNQENGGYMHSNSQSNTLLSSLSSAFTETVTNAFSTGQQADSWPSPKAQLPPGNSQRPRSQTSPILGIDPKFVSTHNNEPLTPEYNLPLTILSSALDFPMEERPSPFGMDTTISSPPLQLPSHSGINGSMTTSSNEQTGDLQSPPRSSAPCSPTQDDVRTALDTIVVFIRQSSGFVDPEEYFTVLKLTEKLRLQNNGPVLGLLYPPAKQDCDTRESNP